MQTTNKPSVTSIAFKIPEGFEYVNFSEIIRIEADCKGTLIYVKNEEIAIKCVSPISIIQEKLPLGFFYRCHRSRIINLQYLKKYVKKIKNTFN